MFLPCGHRLYQHFIWIQRHHLVVVGFTIFTIEHDTHLFLGCRQNLKAHLTIVYLLDVHDEVLRGLLHDAQFTIGHEVLHELLLLVRHEPRKVGLVLSIDTSHQLDIRPETLTV